MQRFALVVIYTNVQYQSSPFGPPGKEFSGAREGRKRPYFPRIGAESDVDADGSSDTFVPLTQRRKDAKERMREKNQCRPRRGLEVCLL